MQKAREHTATWACSYDCDTRVHFVASKWDSEVCGQVFGGEVSTAIAERSFRVE
jgi:hypothetical protein